LPTKWGVVSIVQWWVKRQATQSTIVAWINSQWLWMDGWLKSPAYFDWLFEANDCQHTDHCAISASLPKNEDLLLRWMLAKGKWKVASGSRERAPNCAIKSNA